MLFSLSPPPIPAPLLPSFLPSLSPSFPTDLQQLRHPAGSVRLKNPPPNKVCITVKRLRYNGRKWPPAGTAKHTQARRGCTFDMRRSMHVIQCHGGTCGAAAMHCGRAAAGRLVSTCWRSRGDAELTSRHTSRGSHSRSVARACIEVR